MRNPSSLSRSCPCPTVASHRNFLVHRFILSLSSDLSIFAAVHLPHSLTLAPGSNSSSALNPSLPPVCRSSILDLPAKNPRSAASRCHFTYSYKSVRLQISATTPHVRRCNCESPELLGIGFQRRWMGDFGYSVSLCWNMNR